MKAFFKEHSYNMVKMFLDQFAAAIFGFSLCLACGYARNYTLRNVTSCCAIAFYLFLLYVMTWELGFRDRAALEGGKQRRNPWKGALISLCANSINYLLAIFILLGHLLPGGFFGSLGAFSASAAILLEGMYMGILAHPINGVALNNLWYMYFLIPLPAILTSGIAYYMGSRDLKLTPIGDYVYPDSDRDKKKKRWNISRD